MTPSPEQRKPAQEMQPQEEKKADVLRFPKPPQTQEEVVKKQQERLEKIKARRAAEEAQKAKEVAEAREKALEAADEQIAEEVSAASREYYKNLAQEIKPKIEMEQASAEAEESELNVTGAEPGSIGMSRLPTAEQQKPAPQQQEEEPGFFKRLFGRG